MNILCHFSCLFRCLFNSLKKPTLEYPLLGCPPVSLVGELSAGRNVVVTELSSQFLAAHKLFVFFFDAKPSEIELFARCGVSDEEIAVFDNKMPKVSLF